MVTAGGWGLSPSSGHRLRELLNILWYTWQFPSMKNYPAQNVNSLKVEKPCLRLRVTWLFPFLSQAALCFMWNIANYKLVESRLSVVMFLPICWIFWGCWDHIIVLVSNPLYSITALNYGYFISVRKRDEQSSRIHTAWMTIQTLTISCQDKTRQKPSRGHGNIASFPWLLT